MSPSARRALCRAVEATAREIASLRGEQHDLRVDGDEAGALALDATIAALVADLDGRGDYEHEAMCAGGAS